MRNLVLIFLMCLSSTLGAQAAKGLPPLVAEAASALKAAPEAVTAWASWLDSHSLPLRQNGVALFIYWQPDSVETPYLHASFLSKDQVLNRVEGTGLYWTTVPDSLLNQGGTYQFWWKPSTAFQGDADPGNLWINDSQLQESLILTGKETGGVLGWRRNWKTSRSGSELKARPVFFWVPPGYFQHPDQRYSVAYFQDGQNVWDTPDKHFGGWKAEVVATELLAQAAVRPFIIVGVGNSEDRVPEYLAWEKRAAWGTPSRTEIARRLSDDFDHFFVEEVKPWIDSRLRTLSGREETAVLGSSYGAAVSHHLLDRYPLVFGASAGLSGSGFMPDGLFQKFPSDLRMKVYLDYGMVGSDSKLGPLNQALAANLVRLGHPKDQEVRVVQDDEGEHSEEFWNLRLPEVLKWFFPPRK